MAAVEAQLQAQVEAVLATLVKAATVELIKLFESTFRVSPRSPSQCAGGKQTLEGTDSLSTGGAKRSVGVQVEAQGTFGMWNFLFVQGEIDGSWILQTPFLAFLPSFMH